MTSLRTRRILVLEDEYLLAQELEQMLRLEGAIVIGPFPSLEQAMLAPLDQIDGAILNVHVHDGLSYPLAQRLREQGIPLVFASGQDRLSEPKEWRDNIWIAKPYEVRQLVAALLRVLGVPDAA